MKKMKTCSMLLLLLTVFAVFATAGVIIRVKTVLWDVSKAIPTVAEEISKFYKDYNKAFPEGEITSEKVSIEALPREANSYMKYELQYRAFSGSRSDSYLQNIHMENGEIIMSRRYINCYNFSSDSKIFEIADDFSNATCD